MSKCQNIFDLTYEKKNFIVANKISLKQLTAGNLLRLHEFNLKPFLTDNLQHILVKHLSLNTNNCDRHFTADKFTKTLNIIDQEAIFPFFARHCENTDSDSASITGQN